MKTFQLTVGGMLSRSAKLYPEKIALKCENRSITFSELNKRVNQLGNGLLSIGYKKGDKLSIVLPNSIEMVEVLFACAKIGVIAVPINIRLQSQEIEYIVQQSDSKGIIISEEFINLVEPIIEKLSFDNRGIIVGNHRKDDMYAYEQVINMGDSKEPPVEIMETDTWYLGYTSGTTGLPKGVILNHRTRILPILFNEFGFNSDDIQLLVMPMFHSNGIGFSLTAICRGATTVILKKFDPEEVLQTIHEERITFASMVPTMFNMILNLPENVKNRYDVSSVRLLVSSSAPLLTTTKERVLEFFKEMELIEFYGSSEAGIVTYLEPEDQYRKVRSVGKPGSFVKVKLLDENGNEVKPGEIGELFSFGPCADGYYKLEKETKEAFRDGWFSAGDMAMMDEEGYFYIVDRKKDMIISGGENIYPVEIEEVLSKHPAVYEAAVIGIPNELWGEQVHALIVLKPGANVSGEEIIEYSRTKLAGYKIPRSVEFVEDLPKNPTGKILKRILREKYWKTAERNI